MRKLTILFLLFSCSIWTAKAQKTQEITFVSDTFHLHGTLQLPAGKGPFPLVLMLSGSGPNDRDETVKIVGNGTCLYPELKGQTVKPFATLADSLASHGIASFRYDKCTHTYNKTLDIKELTPYTFIEDAKAALDTVSQLSNIDAQHIFVLGHSQSGNFLPEIAKGYPDVAGLIGIGTASSPIDTLMLQQTRRIMKQCGKEEQLKQAIPQMQQVFALLRSRNVQENMLVMGASPAFWESWIELTEQSVETFSNCPVPTLLVYGTADFNVPLSESKPYEALENVEVDKIKGMTHLMTDKKSGGFAIGLVPQVMAFIHAHTK